MKFVSSLIIAVVVARGLAAGDVLPPANERFKDAAGPEVPNFQRHVIPLMGRLGCNGRACHGSFQGQGGFRLSLFGYDFASDHDALAGGKEPRVDLKDAPQSLMLRKPTLQDVHKGGKRMNVGGWEYNVMLRWIKSGATGRPENAALFTTLEVEPKEIVFAKAGDKASLKVTARWADGTREDVTPLCRFRSNDESIASVDDNGQITVLGKGDTAIVAFYDNGIATVPVLLPVTDKIGANYPASPAPTKIDELVLAKLKKLGVVPSELCTDAEFLRRVSLDMTGTLPTAEEVQQFLGDPSADKRAKKIDELLARPTYAAWWSTKISDFTGNHERNGPLGGEQGLNREKARQWYDWVFRRVNENMPYDQLVEGILMAVGRDPSKPYEDYCKEMSAYFRTSGGVDFATRETMPYFWTRRALGKSEERALAVAHAFLGVNLQCAQCHKHPYDQWTKQDFEQFSAFFSGVRYGGGDRNLFRAMIKGTGLEGLDEDTGTYKRKFADLLASGRVLPFKDLSVPKPPAPKKPGAKPAAKIGSRVITPKLLGGEELVEQKYADVRQPVMDWMREGDNPYFSRAFVNRMWAAYFNVGIIEPADDLNLANPPSNPALLDYLADGFEANKYDMKWVHRTIANSRTYQLSWKPNDTNRNDERNFSHAIVRRLPAEVAYDAILHATAGDAEVKRLHDEPAVDRAIGRASGYGGRGKNEDYYAVQLFGKPPRSINCDCERSNEPALLQSVYLRNDPEVFKLLDRPTGWLKQILKTKGDADELVRQAYLRVLSRTPEDRELSTARKALANDTTAGLRDLMWVLLNTKEFIVNR